jgi:hypothetical protein
MPLCSRSTPAQRSWLRTIAKVHIGLGNEFGSAEQPLSINIKRAGEAPGENPVSSHDVDKRLGWFTRRSVLFAVECSREQNRDHVLRCN